MNYFNEKEIKLVKPKKIYSKIKIRLMNYDTHDAFEVKGAPEDFEKLNFENNNWVNVTLTKENQDALLKAMNNNKIENSWMVPKETMKYLFDWTVWDEIPEDLEEKDDNGDKVQFEYF